MAVSGKKSRSLTDVERRILDLLLGSKRSEKKAQAIGKTGKISSLKRVRRNRKVSNDAKSPELAPIRRPRPVNGNGNGHHEIDKPVNGAAQVSKPVLSPRLQEVRIGPDGMARLKAAGTVGKPPESNGGAKAAVPTGNGTIQVAREPEVRAPGAVAVRKELPGRNMEVAEMSDRFREYARAHPARSE